MTVAVQLFDREGYYATVLADEVDAVHTAVAARTARVPSLVACSMPYRIGSGPGAPDVSLPADYRTELALINRDGKG